MRWRASYHETMNVSPLDSLSYSTGRRHWCESQVSSSRHHYGHSGCLSLFASVANLSILKSVSLDVDEYGEVGAERSARTLLPSQ